VAASALGGGLFGIIQLYPYTLSYYNEAIGGLKGAERHGFELTVGGNYADLYSYLRYLERMPRIYWGMADYNVREYPNAVLKLTVYTLSLDRIWIQV